SLGAQVVDSYCCSTERILWTCLRTLVSNGYHHHFWIPCCDVATRSHALALRVYTRMLPNGDSQLRGRACLRCGSVGKRSWTAICGIPVQSLRLYKRVHLHRGMLVVGRDHHRHFRSTDERQDSCVDPRVL